MNTKSEKSDDQNMITEKYGDQIVTYNPDTHVVVSDPNNPDRVIVIRKIDPPFASPTA